MIRYYSCHYMLMHNCHVFKGENTTDCLHFPVCARLDIQNRQVTAAKKIRHKCKYIMYGYTVNVINFWQASLNYNIVSIKWHHGRRIFYMYPTYFDVNVHRILSCTIHIHGINAWWTPSTDKVRRSSAEKWRSIYLYACIIVQFLKLISLIFVSEYH